jgi:hypothetical protein
MSELFVDSVVEAKSDFGLKIDGVWYNTSKFSKPEVKADFGKVAVKDKVKVFFTVGTDAKKYISKLEINENVVVKPDPLASFMPKDEDKQKVWDEKDKRIVRMNCITNAVNWLTADCNFAECLRIQNDREVRVMSEQERLTQLLNYAAEFERFIYGGKK